MQAATHKVQVIKMLSDVSKQTHKLIALLFAALLLSACGGGGGEDGDADTNSSSSASTSSNTNTAKPDAASSVSSSSAAPDTAPPSATNVQVYKIASTRITLKWQPSADNVAVSFYEIRRNDTIIATPSYPDSSFQDNGLSSDTRYSYTITSVDSSGNRSVRSSPLITKTLPGSTLNTGSSSSASSSDNGDINISSSASSSDNGGIDAASSTSSSSVDNNGGMQTYTWSHPTSRKNGAYLELDEIGGYEIRFKPSLNNDFIYLTLEGNETTSFSSDLIPTNSIVEIAIYDINGLYSDFIGIEPH